MNIKNYILCLLFLVIFPFNIFGVNYHTIKNNLFSVEYDKITAGYGISFQNKNLLSCDYPSKSFTVISIDGKETLLPFHYSIIKTEYKDNSIVTLFKLNNIFVKQILKIDNQSILIKYRIEDEDTYFHKIQCIVVFDIASQIKEYKANPDFTKLRMADFSQPLFFNTSKHLDFKPKIGLYKDFKGFNWDTGKTDSGNAIAFVSSVKSIEDDSFEFFIKIQKQAKMHDKIKFEIDSLDLDFFDSEEDVTNDRKTPEKKVKGGKPSGIEIEDDDLDFFDEEEDKIDKPKEKKDKDSDTKKDDEDFFDDVLD